jgi:hypothetical protein
MLKVNSKIPAPPPPVAAVSELGHGEKINLITRYKLFLNTGHVVFEEDQAALVAMQLVRATMMDIEAVPELLDCLSDTHHLVDPYI